MEETNNSVVSKKGISFPLLIIIIGCVIGLVFCGIGGVRQVMANKTNKDREATALAASQKAVKEANARLSEIETEYNELSEKYTAKTNECLEIDKTMGKDSNWYTNSVKCKNEKSELYSQMTSLESESTAIKNKDYTGYYTKVKPFTYYIFYIIGGAVAGLAILGAFIIYLVKGKKN